MNMSALYFVLGIPLLGSVVLAWCGHRGFARDVNVGFSLATFSAAGVLTAQVISAGPLFAWRHEFFIDPLNVFLVSLTAFVGLTTAIFSRPYMRVEEQRGKMTRSEERRVGTSGSVSVYIGGRRIIKKKKKSKKNLIEHKK